MPPKRKIALKGKKGPPAKKANTEIEVVKTALQKGPSMRKKVHKLDKAAESRYLGGSVVDDYDCMLNQTNIGFNNNKYYVIQLIQFNNKYYVWTRWGRVGEPGSTLSLGPFTTLEKGVLAFEKKYQDKTKNKWNDRENFVPVKGKYTLLEMGDDEGMQIEINETGKEVEYVPSKLDRDTQFLIDLIFKKDMFNHALAQLKLDTKKLPLGALSKPQIIKGFEVLDELDDVISKKKKGNLVELTSKFYTIIPHDFGRKVPPTITTPEVVREKLDMLLVLTDIESTQTLLKNQEKDKKISKVALKPNPLDQNYAMLDSELTILDKKSTEVKIISEFVQNTKSRNVIIENIWKVDRKSEDEKFRIHKDLANRKLLWHGTNIAVVAAILKSGLRIMPHSGGRVGKGIYFASENGKSAGYVSCDPARLGIMFLNEVALGKEKPIYKDDCSIVKPPNGFDSVVAQGLTEPNSKFDKELQFDGKKVMVPLGKPKKRNFESSFYQSEYLVYKESQCRIRYLLLCKF